METYREILEKIFKSPLPYNISIQSDSVIAKWEVPATDKTPAVQYRFEAEKAEGSLQFFQMADFDVGKSWDIGFEASSLRRNSFGITGTGSAFRIFATVLEIMKEFISSKNPKMFHFSAEESSRVKLYDKFAKQIKKLANYHFTKFQGNYLILYVFHKEKNDFENVTLSSGWKKIKKK